MDSDLSYCERCHTWDDWHGNGCDICDRCPECLESRVPGYGPEHDNDVNHKTGERHA